LAVNLKDTKNKKILSNLKHIDSRVFKNGFTYQDAIVVDLRPYAGKEIVLQIQNSFGGNLKPVQINVSEFYPADDKSLAKKGLDFVQEFIPQEFKLHKAYPNPFNPVTHIRFDLPRRSDAKLSVYNLKGQVVVELVNGAYEAGSYEVVFNAGGLASGVYIYHLQAGTFRKSGRMLLIK